ncbi:hypothetical protein F4604DRAFT_1570187, partial [Suillus subluteus]
RCWVTLLYKLESWLVHVVVNTRTPEWTWGCDAFWMAFLAAYPDFPHGSWPLWNSRISLEGAFIESWTLTEDAEDSPALITDHDTIRAGIWTKFQRLATECFPYSLVAELRFSRATHFLSLYIVYICQIPVLTVKLVDCIEWNYDVYKNNIDEQVQAG